MNLSISLRALALVSIFGLLPLSRALAVEENKLIAGFANESRAGIVVTTGNSKTQTYDLSQRNSYEWKANKLSLLGAYLRSTSRGIESARRWNIGLRYDRILADRWSIFVAELVEGDTYAGYLQRYNSDIGAKYFLVKTDINLWSAEAGYRHQHENQTNGATKNSSFARLYSQYEHQWNPSVSSRLWVEYLQNLAVGNDRFINGELSTKAALTDVFSVQLAYLVRYRNLPPQDVAFKTDTTLTAAVLAQF